MSFNDGAKENFITSLLVNILIAAFYPDRNVLFYCLSMPLEVLQMPNQVFGIKICLLGLLIVDTCTGQSSWSTPATLCTGK